MIGVRLGKYKGMGVRRKMLGDNSSVISRTCIASSEHSKISDKVSRMTASRSQ